MQGPLIEINGQSSRNSWIEDRSSPRLEHKDMVKTLLWTWRVSDHYNHRNICSRLTILQACHRGHTRRSLIHAEARNESSMRTSTRKVQVNLIKWRAKVWGITDTFHLVNEWFSSNTRILRSIRGTQQLQTRIHHRSKLSIINLIETRTDVVNKCNRYLISSHHLFPQALKWKPAPPTNKREWITNCLWTKLNVTQQIRSQMFENYKLRIPQPFHSQSKISCESRKVFVRSK